MAESFGCRNWEVAHFEFRSEILTKCISVQLQQAEMLPTVRYSPAWSFFGSPLGDCMKSENWTRMRAASAAGTCLAMLFIAYGARAQETKETVTVNDVDRT